MKEHFNAVAGLVALFLVISAVLALAFHGMKDETLLAILATGSIGIAQQIAGMKPAVPPQPPGSTLALTQTVPLDSAAQPDPAPAIPLAPNGIDRP